MAELELNKIIDFLSQCDKEFENGQLSKESYFQACQYLKAMESLPISSKYTLHFAVQDKLKFIVKQNNFYSIDSASDNISFNLADTLKLIDNYSLSDYIISLVKVNRITDPKLIARFVYLELSKHLYYDISYTQINDKKRKRIIVDTPINVKKAKIFSYVVCTQWLQLYTYILSKFGINVKKMQYEGQDHVWGEIDLGNGEIIIADATEYIDSSIDLSNSKSNSPTKGFIILPKMYSGIRLEYVYSHREYLDLKKSIASYYKQNEELDLQLGYIDKNGYPVNIILNENDLFQFTECRLSSTREKIQFLDNAKKFLLGLEIPKNIDGYEIYAYYHMFIEKLPPEIRGNIGMSTLYADTFGYKQSILRKDLLKAPDDYLKYLQGLIYDRYYQYLDDDEYNKIFSSVKKGLIKNESLGEKFLEEEMVIAQINRRLNPFYAINQLSIYNPFLDDFDANFQLYEPNTGKKVFDSFDSVIQYKKDNKIY